MEKNMEQEKNKEILKQYEDELKTKLKKKVNNVLLNKSLDIKEAINDKIKTASQKKSKNLTIFEDSEKINPLNLLDNFRDEPHSNFKEEKTPSMIESNDIQIKKIRNEISSLKNIINVKKKLNYNNLTFQKVFTLKSTKK